MTPQTFFKEHTDACAAAKEFAKRFSTHPVSVLVNRLVKSLRSTDGRSLQRVCDDVKARPELAEPLVRALAKNDRDRSLWSDVMDRLNPGWRNAVALKNS